MILFGSFPPSPLVGVGTAHFTRDWEADIVMESISLVDVVRASGRYSDGVI
jgi:hypothetical protein